MDVKKELIARGMTEADFDGHETDLYVRATPISKQFLENEYEYASLVTKFVDNIDKAYWYDVPFANVAAWEQKLGRKEAE